MGKVKHLDFDIKKNKDEEFMDCLDRINDHMSKNSEVI